ncbi:ATP-binding protein [Pseudomonas viridiflava]|uniref:ATP-binding protein n=1 Tax=Pseudomonas viridiflava TaxID=33069 RepID=UPI000A427139|nr:ATP-binding protein [Pseudomonas viridiflava]
MENNSWHRYTAGSDVAVVFVHGFFSSAKSCWYNKDAKIFWPDLLISDNRLVDVDVFLGGYYTGIDSGDFYGVRQCAQELYKALSRDSHDGKLAPLKKKKLIFVCHSLGGIVTRYMLESQKEHFAGHVIGLALMASPSLGSDYADSFKGIINFYRNRLGKQLSVDNEILHDLDDRFKEFIDARDNSTFFGVEAVEHLPMINIKILPGFKPIVMKNSAARYFTSQILAGCDHSTIVKPDGHNHPSHNFIIDFMVGKMKLAASSANKSPQMHLFNGSFSDGPLFDIYDPKCELYYLERDVDRQMSKDVSVSSAWLFGPSGSGKTSIIKRLLSKRGAPMIEMCFSQCPSESPRQAFISEMIESIHLFDQGFDSVPDRSYGNLIHMIVMRLNNNGALSLYIDEVPVTSDDTRLVDELLKLTEDILVSVKQRAQANSFRIIVSSLQRPTFDKCQNIAKFNGYLQLRECLLWSTEELESLRLLISEGLVEDVALADVPDDLTSRAGGSPRFVKNFFKAKITRPEMSNSELLLLTAQDFQS